MTHYLAVTCPECLFSAITDKFSSASKVKIDRVLQITSPYKEELNLSFEKTEADAIFAKLYLALAFTHLCYDGADMLDGRLWLNISWMYRDCGDLEMEIYAIKKALEAYNTVYERYNLSKKIEQSVCLIVGELNYKLENIEEAMEDILYDPQTSGGLLISVNSDLADKLVEDMKKNGSIEAKIIGAVVDKKENYITVK